MLAPDLISHFSGNAAQTETSSSCILNILAFYLIDHVVIRLRKRITSDDDLAAFPLVCVVLQVLGQSLVL